MVATRRRNHPDVFSPSSSDLSFPAHNTMAAATTTRVHSPSPSSSRCRTHDAETKTIEEELDDIDRELEERKKRASSQKSSAKKKKKPKLTSNQKNITKSGSGRLGVPDDCSDEPDPDDGDAGEVDESDADQSSPVVTKVRPRRAVQPARARQERHVDDVCFIGDPIPEAEAREKWPDRYTKTTTSRLKYSSVPEDDDMKAIRHYRMAKVDGVVYRLGDDIYIKNEDGKPNYIGRIKEFFEGVDKQLYFTPHWFFRAEDTVIDTLASDYHDPRRLFLSTEHNDNHLDCILSKLRIAKLPVNVRPIKDRNDIPACDYYYDMSYEVECCTFAKLPPDNSPETSGSSSTLSSEESRKDSSCSDVSSGTLSLLDLYAGCGAMSTGLCLGAAFSGLKLETTWAVDINEHACESLRANHPRTKVRNEKAEYFLALLKEWEKLCKRYVLNKAKILDTEAEETESESEESKGTVPKGEFEVRKFVDICYGDPQQIGKVGLQFKVRWKGYGPSEDTWEPIDGLGKCDERIKDFVVSNYRKNILPLPGTVDVICGGPPCQGLSGFNRFRKTVNPLEDEKNQQVIVFMDIVEHLKPKYVLMENVVDIVKLAGGYVGRYAISRLVSMGYQSRLGLMVAGCYGLPQFRMRAFLWGAHPSTVLPEYPLPTHDVVIRGNVPNGFVNSIVAYSETEERNLRKKLLLSDAISDLPAVDNFEDRDEMPYGGPPKTEFQKFIRLSRRDMLDYSFGEENLDKNSKLFDHQPLRLNDDDYQRVKQVPRKKGANFRDLPGVLVNADNVVYLDPSVPRVMLKSKKPLVPDYAISFLKGKSLKPFGRLWWDETVPTVVGRAEPHNQTILHPEQDRVLTIRENARLQGFPDYYKLCGPVKQRYIQVGNAVAVPVARALGYALGRAIQRESGGKPLFVLPPDLSYSTAEDS